MIDDKNDSGQIVMHVFLPVLSVQIAASQMANGQTQYHEPQYQQPQTIKQPLSLSKVSCHINTHS